MALTLLVVGDAHAQKKKSKKQIKANTTELPRYSTTAVEFVPVENWRDSTNQRYGFVSSEPKPEPLIGIQYLLEYPAEAREMQLQGKVRFFATIREGKVASVVLQSDAHPWLLNAVRDAASKLQFDLSWHEPNKPEFQYTSEVTFTLPDNIRVFP